MKTSTERSESRRKRLKAKGWGEVRSIEAPREMHEEVRDMARNYVRRNTLKKIEESEE